MNKEFTFNGQRPSEKVLLVVKNHPFVLFFPGLKTILALLIGISAIIFWSSEYAGLVLLVCVLVAFAIFFRAFYDYSQSVFVVTNQRIINVDQYGFWKRKITETELDKIQDASSETSGILRTMIKFGDLIIRTAGVSQGSEIVVKNIANPYEVQQEIAKIK